MQYCPLKIRHVVLGAWDRLAVTSAKLFISRSSISDGVPSVCPLWAQPYGEVITLSGNAAHNTHGGVGSGKQVGAELSVYMVEIDKLSRWFCGI